MKDVFEKHPVGDPLLTRLGSRRRVANQSPALEQAPLNMFFNKRIGLVIRYLQDVVPVPELATIVEQAIVPGEARQLNKP